MNTVSNCIICHKKLTGKQKRFCSVSCKNDYFLSYDALKARALERKTELLRELGGKCKRCGYMFNISALSFYDKNGESLHIDTSVLANSSLENLRKRLQGAQVLCRNCHEELTDKGFMSWNPSNIDLADNILTRFNGNLRHCGVKSGQTIILGVSGGIDSVTMLDLFTKSDLNLKLIVAHMNHKYRSDSDEDEKVVKMLSESHNLLYEHSHILENVRMSSVGNVEEFFRDERRRFLFQTAKKHHADFVALAHNANDQAETLILNLVRGSGPAGLGAMDMAEDNIIRPLLDISRAEIESYAKENKLEWREDITNKDTNFNRNFVRHRVMPMLQHLNNDAIKSINRTSQLQRGIDSHFKEEAYRIIQETKNKKQNISTERLCRLDKPLLYEVLGLMYEEVRGDRKNLSLGHLKQIEELITKNHGTKTIHLPGKIVAGRSYDKLDFYEEKEDNKPSTLSTKKLKVGSNIFGDWRITAEHGQSSEKNSKSLVIDVEMFKNLRIRTKLAGDKIKKHGLGGTKKLQDLFVDAKIDRVERTKYPVFEDEKNHEIVWVPLLAKAEYKAPSGVPLVTITVERIKYDTKEN